MDVCKQFILFPLCMELENEGIFDPPNSFSSGWSSGLLLLVYSSLWLLVLVILKLVLRALGKGLEIIVDLTIIIGNM